MQHNLGTQTHPILIIIQQHQGVCITNNLVPKRSIKSTSGRGLKNLEEQYKLLVNQPISITKSATAFSVTIPIIYTA